MALSELNSAIVRLAPRAEGQDPTTLIETFEDTGTLFAQLSSTAHQVVYGRRGTGKTHALRYLALTRLDAGDHAVYLDLRTIGSTDSLYMTGIAAPERAARFFIDVMLALHEQVRGQTLQRRDAERISVDDALAWLEVFADSLYSLRIGSEEEHEKTMRASATQTARSDAAAAIGTDGVNAKLGMSDDRSTATEEETKVRAAGAVRHRMNFSDVSEAFRNMVAVLPGRRLWIVIDEWTVMPPDVQPYFADMVKRLLLPVADVTVKIAAIEQRATFLARTSPKEYIGIELGADVVAGIDLDDFMVFGRSEVAASRFMSALLHKHLRSELIAEGVKDVPGDSAEFVRLAFTQRDTFEELVRAAEGVPRDAIHVAGMAAATAGDNRIGVPDVKGAARKFYLSDKERNVAADQKAEAFLVWAIEKVIGGRRARAFLVPQAVGRSSPLIAELYDARVLHVLKKGVSDKDRLGVRFDAYQLDYGCYVHLVTTQATLGVLPDEQEGEYVEVPGDDYRAIRRAILDIEEFEKDWASRN